MQRILCCGKLSWRSRMSFTWTHSYSFEPAVSSGGYLNVLRKLSTKPKQNSSWASIEEQCSLRWDEKSCLFLSFIFFFSLCAVILSVWSHCCRGLLRIRETIHHWFLLMLLRRNQIFLGLLGQVATLRRAPPFYFMLVASRGSADLPGWMGDKISCIILCLWVENPVGTGASGERLVGSFI